MNFKNYFLLLFFTVFVFKSNAQESTPNVPMQANILVEVTPEYISSIASRLADLPPYVDVAKEAADKRSLGNTVIIGKDRQTKDDYFLRNRHESSQSVRVAPPTVVFDAYQSGSTPSDPSMAIGPNHVFVVFNTGFAIYDKSGNLLAGPLSPNPTIFPSSGCCDLTASYDAAADRWVITFLGGGAQVAVSDGPDPINDGWYNYNIGAINDYQKLSVWSDGYYMTDNTGSSNKVWAMERAEMLLGNSAQILGFNLPGIQTSGFYSPQALNVSDANMPASGGATFLYLQDDAWGGVSTDHVKLWTLDMDWDAGNGTMNAAIEIPATEFISVFDGGSFSNLTQPGGGLAVDALQATIMNQAQFRKFDTYNSALFNFVVDMDASGGELAGIRWFELRQDADNEPWSVYQEGTYSAPDGRHAWHGSMIMDAFGNIAMGYTSMAGPTTPNPTDFRISSYYTGRFNGDENSVMTVNEELIAAGNANIPSTRYGDYGKMDIDPSDDTTFWFINEYMNSGRKGVVGAFQLVPPLPDDIGVNGMPNPSTGILTAAENIEITIRNFGSNDITDPEVQYAVDAGSPVMETYPGTILAGETVSYTFTATANLSAPGNHTIIARTDLPGDSNPANDEYTKTVLNGTVYCNPSMDCSFGDGFTNVTVSDLNHDSECEGYADFTAFSAELAPGGSYDFTVTTGYGDQNVRVWIDFNDDGNFTNDETVVPNFVIAPGSAAGTYTETVTLTIPESIPTGNPHRMRVKSNWQAEVSDDPCEASQYGETEDYTANMGVLGLEDLTISQGVFTVLTSPNNQFDITLTTEFDGLASVAIFNVLGQIIAYNNLEKQGDSYEYHLDMSYADAGIYFVRVGDNSSRTYKTAKIIVK
jgi:hypothetical protein